MSVLVNLLPDIRLRRQKEAQRRQLFTGVAGLILIVCGVIVGVLVLVVSSQVLLINKTKGDIKTKMSQLEGTAGLKDALSAQARLTSINSLSGNKTLITKLLSALAETSPTTIQVTAFAYNNTSGKLVMSVSGKSFADASKLARALEAEHVTIGTGSPTSEPYFTNVQLDSVGKSSTSTSTSFSITATVQPGATHGK